MKTMAFEFEPNMGMWTSMMKMWKMNYNNSITLRT
jgi:hypothetical protein